MAIFPVYNYMRLKLLSLFILLLAILPAAHADPVDGVVWLIKQGNITRLSQLFEQTIEITINGQEDTYSRPQATTLLNKFLAEHKVVKIELLHKVNTNEKFLFGVAILHSNNGVFRISYTFNKIGDSMKIIEIRIEPEKTK
jgi:hypothetical protein